MVTRFKLKKDAYDFVQELKERGVTSHVYKGHRDFAVEYEDKTQVVDIKMNSTED